MNDFDRFMDGDLPLRELVYWAREEAEQDLLVDMLSGLLGAIIRGRLTSEQRVKFGAFVDMAACDEAQLALESAYSRGTVSAATLLRSLPQDELVEMTQSAIDSLPQIAEREARYAENRSTRAAAPAAQPDSP
jgi:hypothetical protein